MLYATKFSHLLLEGGLSVHVRMHIIRARPPESEKMSPKLWRVFAAAISVEDLVLSVLALCI